MEQGLRKRIWKAVDEFEKNPEKLRGIKNGSGYYTHSGQRYDGTYHENYHIIKSLNLGHRPTKEETDECSFYAVAKLIGDGDAVKGVKKVISNLRCGNE